jgi:predicted membrane protein
MLKKVISIPFIFIFTLLLLVFTYATRISASLCAIFAYFLSYFVIIYDSSLMFKIISTVLSFGELSCVINKKKQGEENEESRSK